LDHDGILERKMGRKEGQVFHLDINMARIAREWNTENSVSGGGVSFDGETQR
jgi:hypothetical protein